MRRLIALASRDGKRCSVCGHLLRFRGEPKDEIKRRTALSSHELPKEHGGTDGLFNRKLICNVCEKKRHRKKSNEELAEKALFTKYV